jgi:hypothetical protein
MVGVIGNPVFNTFSEGWRKWVAGKAFEFPYVYWNPVSQDWRTYSPGKVQDKGLASVSVTSGSPALIYPEVERTWSSVKGSQPGAIWNPRNGQWLVGPGAPGPVVEDVVLRRMREELARVDAAFASGDITAEQRDEQKRQIIDRYL